MHKISKLTISDLVFIIVNNKSDVDLREEAKKELKRRCILAGWDSEKIIYSDSQKIFERGYDINKYLIGPRPSMQLLMELYLSYVYDNDCLDNMLLFSEKHICSETGVFTSFFDRICLKEIENLKMRETSDSSLSPIRELLENRIASRKDGRQLMDVKYLFRCDDAFVALFEEKFKIVFKFNKEFLNAIDYDEDDFFEMFSDWKNILRDSKLLSDQKRILLSEAEFGYKVNYETSVMKRALVRSKR